MSQGTVLVTGATGFAGGHLVEHLQHTADVVGWGRTAPPPALQPVARWRQVDLLNRLQVRVALEDANPRAVYHCAGVPHVGQSFTNTTTALEGNVLATHILLDELRRRGAPVRVLVTGSATVYAAAAEPIPETGALSPTSPYAVSKLAQEGRALRALAEDGVDVVVARAFNHTGPRQSPDFAAPSFARQLALIERGRLEPVIRVGNLEAIRDFTDVRDVVRAYRILLERGAAGAIYNVASGAGRSIRSVLDALVARARVPVEVATDPAKLRPSDTPALVGDSARLQALGWQPGIGFDQLIDDLLDYWRHRA